MGSPISLRQVVLNRTVVFHEMDQGISNLKLNDSSLSSNGRRNIGS